MGMYNEVYKNCYNCGHVCEIQIPQVILGFGGFNLDDPANCVSIRDLTCEQKLKLAQYVSQESFYCNHDSRNSSFTVEVLVGHGSKNTKVII